MSFLLDTDICSAHLRDQRAIASRLLQHSGQLHISAVTLGELLTWTLRVSASASRRRALADFLDDIHMCNVDVDVAYRFGITRAQLLDVGKPVSTADLLIAATAMHHDLTLVTHNVAHFSVIPGLRVEDWLAP